MRFSLVSLSFLLFSSLTLLPFAGQAQSEPASAAPSPVVKTDTMKSQVKPKPAASKKHDAKTKSATSKKKGASKAAACPPQ